MSGILALQNDVARRVAESLALRLLPAERERLASARTVNPEAHEAYLKGFFHLMKLSPGDLDIAEKYFDLALEKDPAYAPAYAGRAYVWSVRDAFGLAPPEAAVPKAEAAALKAIELDEDLAVAHEALGGVRWLQWNWDGARRSFLRAIELNPSHATAQGNYGWLLLTMGHGEEALVRIEKAVALDPFNPLVHGWHAAFLCMQRRYDDAIVAAREALRLQEGSPIALNILWLSYRGKGMEKEAIEAAKHWERVWCNDPRIQAAMDEGYAQGGYAEAMKRAAEVSVARLSEAHAVRTLPLDIASFYAEAGVPQKAIDWLEKAYEARNYGLVYLGCDSAWDDLRPDPRFQALLRRMNLPVQAPSGTPQPTGSAP
jgi:Tfp pilus assembly protein PilF